LIPCQRHLFDIPPDVSYFNNGSLAPLLKTAQEAARDALATRSAPWRIGADDWFSGVEERRTLFAGLIGGDPNAVALVPATSYGLATAAKNLSARPDQRVLIIADDYPSNVYTWRTFCHRHGCELVTVTREPGAAWTDGVLAAIDERAAIVAVPNVHWTDGSLLDLVAISRAVRAAGGKLIVDASQSLGAMPLDLAAVRPDFLVAVGYKWLLGPFGLGYLYVAPEHRDGSPLEENWIAREGADDFGRLTHYTNVYQPGSRRFDVGERSLFEVTPMASAALRQLNEWTVDAVAATLGPITGRIEQGARALGVDVESAGRRAPHMLGLRLPHDKWAKAGDHFKRAGVTVGIRPGTVRIAPHLYTTDEDVERLLAALTDLLRC
jgi:selenocysteine lyase/cysteine desulfurase